MSHKVERKRSTGRGDLVWWTELQAAEWIAFRGATPPIPWPPAPVWVRELGPNMLDALAARADISFKPRERIYLPDRGEWTGGIYARRARMRALLRAWSATGILPAALSALARELAEAVRTCDAKRAAASSDLLAAVRSGRLPIYGRRPLPDVYGNPTNKPAGEHEPISDKVFADSKLTVQGGAVTVPLGSPEWYWDWNRRRAPGHDRPPALHPLYIEVRFRVRDVRKLWKANPLGAERRKSKSVSEDKLKEKAAALVAGLLPGERIFEPAGIERLQELLGASREAARDAWKFVPKEYKNSPGRRKAAKQSRG